MVTLPKECQNHLHNRKIRFEGCVDGDRKAIVLKEFALPEGRFDVSTADILILLPDGYPDAPPDMFYTIPRLKLATSGDFPSRTDGSLEFNGHTWQQWSRHSTSWRPGVDGIWTMIKRIENALESAR